MFARWRDRCDAHVLAHPGYDGELQTILSGFRCVLAPGGRLRVSVQDMEVLCRLFLLPNMDFQSPHDVHYTGMFYAYLGAMMHGAGFRNIERVAEFDAFKDASSLMCGNVHVSLNVQAVK